LHIPDGYLSPIISIGMGAATVPTWAIATRKVQSILNNRTVPLLAIFAALSFTIMMFNVPVPGGTTAHGVGGTLAAIVLGPWAAVITVSVALIIQALFFGDGGVLAIFANCLNMAIILPFTGYATYRLLSRGAPLLGTRRVWAAGIGAYVGITVSAIAVGIELGIQPMLFTENGHALYSPYGLSAAIPAMLLAHAFGASIVEGLITALGVAYLQKRHPEYLTSLRRVYAPDAATEGATIRRPLWQLVLATIGVGIAALGVLGLVEGGGDPARFFGGNWSTVDWASVATMLLVTLVIGAVMVPLAYLILPGRLKRIGAGFMVLAVIAPLGLIAPGFAYGEGGTAAVQQAFGYVPGGLQQLSGFFSAPLSGYNLPLPFFDGANAALWQSAIGYEIAGIVGILLIGTVMLALSRLILRLQSHGVLAEAEAQPETALSTPTTPPRPAAAATSARQARDDRPASGHVGWLEQTLAGITESIERAVFSERHARIPGFLQRVDPRAKLAMFLVLILAASFTSSFWLLVGLYLVILAAARASRIPFDFFVKRVWLGIPFFAAIVVIPSIFFVPGERLFDVGAGPIHIAPSIPGLIGAAIFIARVGVSVSLAILLVMTTPWADILKSLRLLRVPQVFVLVLSMTYRYIFLFLHTTNGIFLARKSRTVARTTGREQRRWISGTIGNLMSRAFKMSNDVYAAMLARGFTGEMRAYSAYRMRARDWASLTASVVVSVGVLAVSRVLP
jgi:cobalt ECF transporter T component CbiQ/cobalamin biosynthesis protein CbiM